MPFDTFPSQYERPGNSFGVALSPPSCPEWGIRVVSIVQLDLHHSLQCDFSHEFHTYVILSRLYQTFVTGTLARAVFINGDN